MKTISLGFLNKQLANRPGKPEMDSPEAAALVVKQAEEAGKVRALLRYVLRTDA